MGTVVIVHGAWGGGWEWSDVRGRLQRLGHDVFTPTLGGLGDRSHEGMAEAISLSTHVADLVALLELEDLQEVVLCGASHGGIAEHGASWRVPMPAPLWDSLMPAGSLPDGQRADYRARIRDHPASSLAEPIRLSGPVERLPRAFVRCTGGRLAEAFDEDPIAACAHRARTQGWIYRELDTGHDPQVFDPEGVTAVLHDLASGS